ncbi:matrix Gla protein-like [Platysternon megacephalum]|uniref:Matrix Gla protein-like n=1 Tax=Platysternon megacephalum TaxID=55544 RepID=A0A4D9ED91_9SAUR|nr:matrix Gla protein-like [Platysternon megacephalum]
MSVLCLFGSDLAPFAAVEETWGRKRAGYLCSLGYLEMLRASKETAMLAEHCKLRLTYHAQVMTSCRKEACFSSLSPHTPPASQTSGRNEEKQGLLHFIYL